MFSSTSSEAVGPLLVESFRLIREGNPAGYQELLKEAGLLRVGLEVDEEHLAIVFTEDGVTVRPGLAADVDAHVSTDRETIGLVLEGRVSLVDAVLGERIVLKGPLEVLIRLHDGLVAYVRAAVRTPRHRQGLSA